MCLDDATGQEQTLAETQTSLATALNLWAISEMAQQQPERLT